MVLGGPATQRGGHLQGEANSTEKHRLDSEKIMKLMKFSIVIFSVSLSGEDDLTGPRDPSTKVRDIHQERGARVWGAARRAPAGGGDQPGADHGAGAEGAHARPQAPSPEHWTPGLRHTRS